LKEINEYADIYSNFPEGENINEIAFIDDEKRFFHVIENLMITTAYPLILKIYQKLKDKNERIEVLKLLESYLVRRNVCRLTTKNYNNLFISIIQKINKDEENRIGLSYSSLKNILISFTEETNIFPLDIDFREAFSTKFLSNQNSKEILFCISLYQKSNGLNDVTKLCAGNFSVEHFLPVKWQEFWSEPNMTADKKAQRTMTLKTLGNLTLVTQKLNSKMSNSAWPIKKDLLKTHSSLKITTDYVELETWDEASINDRANTLSDYAIKIWPR
jgi:hypothetical protein